MELKRLILPIFATGILTVLVTLLVLNLRAEKKIAVRPVHAYPVADQQFLRSMSVLLGPPLLDGNRVQTLLNGEHIFPAMLQAISAAKRTIDFETYIYWSGEIGKRFAGALAERARAGVKVNVLVDWLGSQKMDNDSIETMTQAGVDFRKYRPLRWYNLGRVNNRTHRKLLIVDGRIGFTGGVGIADNWTGDAQDPEHWRDNHYRIEGPAVAQMQAAFMDNWTKVTGSVLHEDPYFPVQKSAGPMYAQVFQSSSQGGSESMHLMYLLSIAAATKSIDLAMAYFVPDEITSEALVSAMKRGVRVRLILPGEYVDTDVVRNASRASWGPLLQAGAVIHEYQPTMYHVKLLIVDGLWSSVGSTNFDARSFRLNDEANLNVYDAEFARVQTETFEADLKRSRRITYEQWNARPWHEKLKERAAALLSSQL
ncbi:MAG TPA: phospholipase D-like domain-containing protein [Burkholderiaceae bacterium]|nr:phospholipase D-like domain-containing protein [Burkholderiaceae bacterium]